MIKLLVAFLLFVAYFGNISHEPKIEDKENDFTIRSIPYTNEHEVVVVSTEGIDKRFQVNYELKEQDIYIECLIKNFSFEKDKVGSLNKEGEGHIQLYVNESKVDLIFQPSFIIKSLPSGTYKIKLQLVHNDSTPYDIEEEFEITI